MRHGITQHRELGCEGSLFCCVRGDPPCPASQLCLIQIWIWKEKLELLLQWIQTGLSSAFEVVMGAVSCTRWPKLLPGHTAQSREMMELRVHLFFWAFVSFLWGNTNSWLEEHQQLIDQSIFKAVWTIDLLSHLGALGGACHCIVWIFQIRIRKSYQLLQSSSGFLLKDREEGDEKLHMGYCKTEISLSPKVRLLYVLYSGQNMPGKFL